jgi:hypothetical protein
MQYRGSLSQLQKYVRIFYHMERRRHKRIAVGYKAEIVCNGKSYECVIEDIAPSGTNIVTALTQPETDFKPQETVELKFEPFPGETVHLTCRIMWSRKTMPHRLTDRIGLEIINPDWDRCGSFL